MRHWTDTQTGSACVATFVLCSSVRDIYFSDIFQSASVFLVLLVAFGMATVAGLGLSLAKGERLQLVARFPRNVILMNLGTAGAWFCYFLALKWLEPSIVNTLFAGIGPFAVIALNGCGLVVSTSSPTTSLQKALQLGVIASMLALIWVVVSGRSGFQNAHPLLALGGAGLALISGILITVGHLYAKRLSESGISSAAILGTRFFALVIVAAMGLIQEGTLSLQYSLPAIPGIAFAALLLIVIPIFFNQIGMARISPLNARVITAAGPALVFALQQIDPRISWSTETFAAIIAYSGFVVTANLVHGGCWRTASSPLTHQTAASR